MKKIILSLSIFAVLATFFLASCGPGHKTTGTEQQTFQDSATVTTDSSMRKDTMQ